jgi:hypothetical protein
MMRRTANRPVGFPVRAGRAEGMDTYSFLGTPEKQVPASRFLTGKPRSVPDTGFPQHLFHWK